MVHICCRSYDRQVIEIMALSVPGYLQSLATSQYVDRLGQQSQRRSRAPSPVLSPARGGEGLTQLDTVFLAPLPWERVARLPRT